MTHYATQDEADRDRDNEDARNNEDLGLTDLRTPKSGRKVTAGPIDANQITTGEPRFDRSAGGPIPQPPKEPEVRLLGDSDSRRFVFTSQDKPDDVEEFSKVSYGEPYMVDPQTRRDILIGKTDTYAIGGITTEEKELLDKCPIHTITLDNHKIDGDMKLQIDTIIEQGRRRPPFINSPILDVDLLPVGFKRLPSTQDYIATGDLFLVEVPEQSSGRLKSIELRVGANEWAKQELTLVHSRHETIGTVGLIIGELTSGRLRKYLCAVGVHSWKKADVADPDNMLKVQDIELDAEYCQCCGKFDASIVDRVW